MFLSLSCFFFSCFVRWSIIPSLSFTLESPACHLIGCTRIPFLCQHSWYPFQPIFGLLFLLHCLWQQWLLQSMNGCLRLDWIHGADRGLRISRWHLHHGSWHLCSSVTWSLLRLPSLGRIRFAFSFFHSLILVHDVGKESILQQHSRHVLHIRHFHYFSFSWN